MKRITDSITKINETIGKIDNFLIYFLTAFIIYAIVMRRFLNITDIWSYEVTQFTFGAYFVLAGGYVLAQKRHVTMDIIYNRFSVKNRALIDLITSIFFFIFVGVLLWTSLMAGLKSFEMREVSSASAWAPPIYPIKLIIPLGAFLLLIQGIVQFIDSLRIVLGVSQDEH